MAASPPSPRLLPAIVTAGGRLSGPLTESAGTSIKALAPLGGRPLVAHVLDALRASGRVGTVAVVGPRGHLAEAGIEGHAPLLVDEGQTGPENILRGLRALAELHGSGGKNDGHVLLSATDVPFLTGDSVRALVEAAEADAADADIVFPILHRRDYESRFPGSPNEYARLRDGELTGGSVQLVRPSAIEANLPLIEKAFAARKSQVEMARLLGLPFILRFLTRQLTVAQAEEQASRLTGCRCRALVVRDARLAADIDSVADYDYARGVWDAHHHHGRGAAENPGGGTAPRGRHGT